MDQEKAPQTSSKSWQTWLVVTAAVLAGFIIVNALIWAAYNGRAYPGVTVGSQAVGNMTTSSMSAKLSNATRDNKIKISVQGQTKNVMVSDMGITYDVAASAQAAVTQGKHYLIPLYGLVYTWNSSKLPLSYKLDQTKLTRVARELAGTDSVPATDAKVVIEGEAVRVEDDKPGQGIDSQVLAKRLVDAAVYGNSNVSVQQGSVNALIRTSDAQAMAVSTRKVMALPITITVGAKTFTPDATQVGKWLTVAPADGKLTLQVNQAALNAYIDGLAVQLDLKATNKQINMVNGVVRTVSEGKNGLALDKAALAGALSKIVATGTNTAVVGSMNPVAFKTLTNNTVDLEGKYIEVNLSRQHLWAYDNKQLVYDTPITSGATGAGFATIQGLFSIKAKQTNRNLNGYAIGYNYNVFVNYWMPFSGNYGMHDASWRTSFGGADYYYGGSHGCVNLPAAAAAWVYNFVNVGTPVWVHS